LEEKHAFKGIRINYGWKSTVLVFAVTQDIQKWQEKILEVRR
jgi:hypothetical protein